MSQFADIILPLSISQTYTYAIPEEFQDHILIGMRVIVHFGSRKFYTGIILSLHDNVPEGNKIKSISLLLDDEPILLPLQLKLWQFVSDYYRSNLGEVYKAAIPSAMKLESETVLTADLDRAAEMDLNPAEITLLDQITARNTLSVQDLTQDKSDRKILSHIYALCEKGVLTMQESLVGGYRAKYETCFRLTEPYRNHEVLTDLLEKLKKAPKQHELLVAYLAHFTSFEHPDELLAIRKPFLDASGVSLAVYNALESRGVFQTVLRQKDRIAYSDEQLQPLSLLSSAQQQAYDSIKELFKTKETVLLHGVTSSGKTEVYMHLIQETIAQGKQVLFLVPEIGLTTQLASRLRKVFGSKLGVYHSRFSDHERVEIWNNLLLNKGYQIILGVRSSVFLPYSNLGLVIVDEEHDASYKQQDPAPRYHARNIAQMLTHLHGARTLLATATPSIESYTHAMTRKYGLVELSERFSQISLPEIQLVDFKESYRKHKMRGHFSLELIAEVEQTLSRGEQVILFQNRRGFAPVMECRNCGWVPKCPNCDVSLTYHKAFNKLTCHYCGYTQQLPTKCPQCDSEQIESRGFGTEQIEQEVSVLFPKAKVARMDLDTTRTKRSFEKIIDDFENHRVDILIGTQMVTKGLDFDNVALVGILNADNLLNFPDFRSYERAYQLLVQVSGRAGRKGKQGKVLMQTSYAETPLMSQICNNDYKAFFDQQMFERQTFKYPPYFRLIRIVLKHKDSQVVNKASFQLADLMKRTFGNRVLGPDVPAVGRIQNKFIKHLLLKVEVNASFERAKHLLDDMIRQIRGSEGLKSLLIYLDVDPM